MSVSRWIKDPSKFTWRVHRVACALLAVTASVGYFFSAPSWERLVDSLIGLPLFFFAFMLLLYPLTLLLAAVLGFVSGGVNEGGA